MFMLQGQYERDEVYNSFDIYPGASHWPSDNPKDSPYDKFKCKFCGKEFRLLMAGSRYIGQPDFIEEATMVLAEHLNIKHPR